MIFLNVSGEFAYDETLINVTYLISQICGTLLNCFVFFIIWKYSTLEMKDYKIYLLLYQVGSGSLDFNLDFLSNPVFFFPYIAGTSQGILHKTFGIDTILVAIIAFTCAAVIVHFIIVNPLLYRWQVILPDTDFLKIQDPKKSFFFKFGILAIVGIPVPIFFYSSWEDNEFNKESFRKTYPQDANLADVEGFVWVNTKAHPSFMYGVCWLGFWNIFAMCILVFCNISIIRTLEALKQHMSPATRAAHIKFLRIIGLQTLIPLLWLGIPVGYWLTVLFGNIRYPGHQNITNISVALAGSHGAMGSLVLLFSNSCYRKGIYSIFIQPFRQMNFATTLHAPSSQVNVIIAQNANGTSQPA